jgi:hypothetical protein
VHPRGGELLTAVVDTGRHPLQAGKLRRLPGALRIREGAEVRVDFRVADAQAVFAIIQPARRRQVSDAERARLREIGVATRFNKGVRHGVEATGTGEKADATVAG